MRAIYLNSFHENVELDVAGDSFHHLVNVLRVKSNEEILVLNGNGLIQVMQISQVSKKSLKLIPISYQVYEKPFEMDLFLYVPKREALELSLKQAVEIGISKIHLIQGDYSQQKIPELERMYRLMESALEQSNNPFLPELKITDNLPEFHGYELAIFFDSTGNGRKERMALHNKKYAMIIGPEGGFSEREITHFKKLSNTICLRLPTPIMRTPTALAVGAGYLINSFVDL